MNGPAATVVSGESAALGELIAACAAAGIRARMLPVDYASHSAQVGPLRDEILAALDGIAPGPARIPMISAMTGQWLAGPEAGAGYWYDSLRAPVRFAAAARTLTEAGYRVFAEMSPHPVLTAAITETAADAGHPGPVVTGTLRRDDGGRDRFLASLAAVHVRGVRVDWPAVLGPGRRVDLPTYAFQRQRYWPQAAPAGAEPARPRVGRHGAPRPPRPGSGPRSTTATCPRSRPPWRLTSGPGWTRCCPRWRRGAGGNGTGRSGRAGVTGCPGCRSPSPRPRRCPAPG